MSYSQTRKQAAHDRRAALRDVNKRTGEEGPKVEDAFGRRLAIHDGVLLAQTEPMAVVWRITGLTPATEPQYQGGVWMDVVARTRVLAAANVQNPNIVLGPLAPEAPQEEPDDSAPAPERSPGGIILSDPDRSSER